MKIVIKRNGEQVQFDRKKILDAIEKARIATGEFEAEESEELTNYVCRSLEYDNRSCIDIEHIQDCVENVLIKRGRIKTAKSYIIYRAQHDLLRRDKATIIDVEKTINEYLSAKDWRIKANANQGYSLGGMILGLAGKVVANYWLNHVYPREIGDLHREGDIHIHDLDLLTPYCAGWSLRMLLQEGFNGVPGKVDASPPKHMSSAVGQIVNFLGTLQNEWAGAQAFSSFDTLMAPYIRKDGMTYEEVRQCIQELIYNLNVPSRWASQTPFTNLTFDWACPDDLKEQRPNIAGEEMDFTYGDLHAEMDMINQAYIEVMFTGDAKGQIFSFPIPTYNITKDFQWGTENANSLFEMTAKYGVPYFQNFISSDLSPQMVRSMCCRLQLDLRELQKRGNGLFGSSEQTGSIGVVTINCARLGYLYRNNIDGLYDRLDSLLDAAKASLEIKRKEIKRHLDNGLYPFTKRYLGTFRNHFSTIGVNGINEMIKNHFAGGRDISSESGIKMASAFLDHIRARMVEFQNETGHMYNLEATPAEGATYRFAREDAKRYDGIVQAGTKEAPYYTNSSQLPVMYTDDVYKAMVMQEELQQKYTGGTVFHIYTSERIKSAEACKNLIKRTMKTFRLPYITVTPTFSICTTHGYLTGEVEECPQCGQRTQVWTRVMGYYRPTCDYNLGKQSEHNDRLHYTNAF